MSTTNEAPLSATENALVRVLIKAIVRELRQHDNASPGGEPGEAFISSAMGYEANGKHTNTNPEP